MVVDGKNKLWLPGQSLEEEPLLGTTDEQDLSERPLAEPSEEDSGQLYTLQFNPGLTEADKEEAYTIIRWLQGSGHFYGIAGLMLVTGMPRQGKGLFSNTFAWKIKRLFYGKHVLRDDHPKPLFGDYTLFNEDILMEDLARMNEAAGREGVDPSKFIDLSKSKNNKKNKADVIRSVNEWKGQRGQVLFKNAVAVFDEFWRYMNKRRPMAVMNLALGGIIKMWGHLDLMLLGQAQRQQELDVYTCLPYVTHEVRCQFCTDRPNTVESTLYRVMWSSAKNRLVPVDRPVRIFIDGGRFRPELGGKRYFDLYNSKSSPMLTSFIRTKNDRGEM